MQPSCQILVCLMCFCLSSCLPRPHGHGRLPFLRFDSVVYANELSEPNNTARFYETVSPVESTRYSYRTFGKLIARKHKEPQGGNQVNFGQKKAHRIREPDPPFRYFNVKSNAFKVAERYRRTGTVQTRARRMSLAKPRINYVPRRFGTEIHKRSKLRKVPQLLKSGYSTNTNVKATADLRVNSIRRSYDDLRAYTPPDTHIVSGHTHHKSNHGRQDNLNIIDRRGETTPEMLDNVIHRRKILKSSFKEKVYSPVPSVVPVVAQRNPATSSKSQPPEGRLRDFYTHRRRSSVPKIKNSSRYQTTGLPADVLYSSITPPILVPQSSLRRRLHRNKVVTSLPPAIPQKLYRVSRVHAQPVLPHNSVAPTSATKNVAKETVYAIPRDRTQQKLLLILLLRRFGLLAVPANVEKVPLVQVNSSSKLLSSTTVPPTEYHLYRQSQIMKSRAPINLQNFLGFLEYGGLSKGKDLYSPVVTALLHTTLIPNPKPSVPTTHNPAHVAALQRSLHERHCGANRTTTEYYTPGMETLRQSQVDLLFGPFTICRCMTCSDCDLRPRGSVAEADEECGSKQGSSLCCCCEAP